MIYNHLISTHGAQCTSCAWSPKKDVFKLPPNVVVVMNCYNTTINSNDVIDAKVWQLATNKNLMNALKDIVNASSTTNQIMDTVTTYISILNMLLNGNGRNKYCMYFDECPNMFIAKETKTFRSGIYSLPVSIIHETKAQQTQRKRELTEDDFGYYPFNDVRTNELIHDFLIPSSTSNPYWKDSYKIKSYGVRENEEDLSSNYLENNTLRAIIEDINTNSGGNGFHVVLFVACACGGIDPTPYQTELYNNKSQYEAPIAKFTLKFMNYLVNHINRTVCTQTLCTIVPEILARSDISNNDPQTLSSIENSLNEGYCKKPTPVVYQNNTKVSTTSECLYLSAIGVDTNSSRVIFDRKHIKDWIIRVRGILPVGWTLDVYDIEDDYQNINENYVLLQFLENGLLTDELKLFFDSSYNFAVKQTDFTTPKNNRHILYKNQNGNYHILYKPSCANQIQSNTSQYTVLKNEIINNVHVKEPITLSSDLDNKEFNALFFDKSAVDAFIGQLKQSGCMTVNIIDNKRIDVNNISSKQLDNLNFIIVRNDDTKYMIYKYQLFDPQNLFKSQNFKNFSVRQEHDIVTIHFECSQQQGGFIMENGKVFLVNANKKHLVQLDKQQRAIIKIKGKNVLLKDIIVLQKKPKTTTAKVQKPTKKKGI